MAIRFIKNLRKYPKIGQMGIINFQELQASRHYHRPIPIVKINRSCPFSPWDRLARQPGNGRDDFGQTGHTYVGFRRRVVGVFAFVEPGDPHGF